MYSARLASPFWKPSKSLHIFFSRWMYLLFLGGWVAPAAYCSSFISVVACSLFITSSISKIFGMRFAHNSFQPVVPAFDMIVCSWPIVVVVVPLLESELTIDPGGVKVRDKVFDIVQFWGFLLNSLPCHSNKAWGDETGCRCLLHKSFQDTILRPVLLLQSQSLNLSPDCLEVVVVVSPVGKFNRRALMRACSKSERTEEGVRSRPKFSAASFTIMNIRLYVLCCLLGSRGYTIGKVWPYLMMWMEKIW